MFSRLIFFQNASLIFYSWDVIQKRKIWISGAILFFLVFVNTCRKSPKISLKIVICSSKLDFSSSCDNCSNSHIHELWTFYLAQRKVGNHRSKYPIKFRFLFIWDALYRFVKMCVNAPLRPFVLKIYMYNAYQSIFANVMSIIHRLQ